MNERKSIPAIAAATTLRDYRSPQLRVYGALTALTRNVGKKGTVADSGGFGNMTKTS